MAPTNERGQFSADAAALGYFYQVRLALVEALKGIGSAEDFSIFVETIDDVVFEKSDSSLDILQTKHHVSRTANLTDASEDLWKTIRIWCELIKSGSLSTRTKFFLVTTGVAGEGTAPSYLRANSSRAVNVAIERLNSTAVTSVSVSNKDSYDAYKALSVVERKLLFESVFILDGAPDIANLEGLLRQAVYIAVDDNQVTAFLERLEGWWFRRVLEQLYEKNPLPILREELSSALSDFRDQFRRDNLPVDLDLMIQSIDASGYQDKVFVEQLRLIGLGNPRILIAINEYFRAYEQRSRWMRENLLFIGELGKYEAVLEKEWNIRFEQMKQRLGDDATEEAMKADANTLYEWIESGLHPTVRPRVTEPSIARGTFHMLANYVQENEPRVGWHADFKARIRTLLEARGN